MLDESGRSEWGQSMGQMALLARSGWDQLRVTLGARAALSDSSPHRDLSEPRLP
ncbi:MAG: hypothetical protein QOI92_1635, partial [Chloroflexota bacterium]|nr:hypothetical protein [Chloroflexota bacterium]